MATKAKHTPGPWALPWCAIGAWRRFRGVAFYRFGTYRAGCGNRAEDMIGRPLWRVEGIGVCETLSAVRAAIARAEGGAK